MLNRAAQFASPAGLAICGSCGSFLGLIGIVKAETYINASGAGRVKTSQHNTLLSGQVILVVLVLAILVTQSSTSHMLCSRSSLALLGLGRSQESARNIAIAQPTTYIASGPNLGF